MKNVLICRLTKRRDQLMISIFIYLIGILTIFDLFNTDQLLKRPPPYPMHNKIAKVEKVK